LSLILKLIYIVSTTPSLIGSTIPSALPLQLNHKSLLISTQVFWNSGTTSPRKPQVTLRHSALANTTTTVIFDLRLQSPSQPA
ncbi:hypothetical protein CSPX01_11089, partial [Colletotrichum filicis]